MNSSSSSSYDTGSSQRVENGFAILKQPRLKAAAQNPVVFIWLDRSAPPAR